MPHFLIRSFTDPKGYTVITPSNGLLPRSREESYVPWAITAGGEVVYARTGEHTGFRGGGGRGGPALRPYDFLVSQSRRRLCEASLGMIALKQPQMSRTAVDRVSAGVKMYLIRNFFKNPQAFRAQVFKEIGHYFFTDKHGFGRLSDATADSSQTVTVWTAILDALHTGSVDQKLAIHDAIGRKILPKYPGRESVEYNRVGPLVRQDWFDDAKRRGRANASSRARPTTLGGTATPGTQGLDGTAQARIRGVDSFVRDMHRTSDVQANAYYDDVDIRNLLFGAGISGTTGTLLQAAAAFGKISTGEELKQYVFAIVGYLVGGGMHSAHESLAVAQKLGLPYEPGAFVPSLPASFVQSSHFLEWSAAYYDIVWFGATHWRFNQTHLPSHLNRDLRTS